MTWKFSALVLKNAVCALPDEQPGLEFGGVALPVPVFCPDSIVISVFVNGEIFRLPNDSTMSTLLENLKINSRYCAVEQNQELVPREQHVRTPLADGDRVEIVTLVGGG